MYMMIIYGEHWNNRRCCYYQPEIVTLLLYIDGKLFSKGKFWWTIQVKASGEEKFGEQATVSAYAIYVFCVSVNIGENYYFDK